MTMTMRGRETTLLLALLLGLACAGAPTGPEPPPPPPIDHPLPLTELTGFAYRGLLGGLYPGGGNEPPAGHAAAGRAALARIEPLDAQGRPDPDGKIVLISVGMSTATQEFCSQGGSPPCEAWSFMGQARDDAAVDGVHLEIVNGADGGQTPPTWDEPSDTNYDRVIRNWLEPRELTERQIQIAWVKEANPDPTVSLPAAGADAYVLEAGLGRMVRAMKVRWPNLRIVFFSSRIYGGYATSSLNPEPYAFETGFSVRNVIEAQIQQDRTGTVDPQSGDLARERAPWLAWGPYLWADGTNPRADGLVWRREDFVGDGTHPSERGEEKVGRLLLGFFKLSPFAQCWFLVGRSCR